MKLKYGDRKAKFYTKDQSFHPLGLLRPVFTNGPCSIFQRNSIWTRDYFQINLECQIIQVLQEKIYFAN